MNAVSIRLGKDGKKYLHARFSNRWRDRDFHSDPWHGGQIVASHAHVDYEKWVDKHPSLAPELWTWHEPGTQRKSRASWLGWSGDYMHAEWPLTDEEATAIEKWKVRLEKGGSRMATSFGFYTRPNMYDEMDGSIGAYRAFEASLLPVEVAANQWMDREIVNGGKGKMAKFKKEKRDALVELHGEEFVNELEMEDGEAAEILGVSVESRGVSEEAGGPAALQSPEGQYASESLVVEALERLKNDVEGGIAAVLEGVTAAIESLSKRLGAVEEIAKREETAAKAEAAPPSVLAQWVKSGSVIGKAAAVVKEDTTLASAAPQYQTHELGSLLQDVKVKKGV